MYAIVKTGGKQYMVNEGDEIKVEKLNVSEGESVDLEVVAISSESGLKLGSEVSNAKVKAEVIKNGKSEKIIVFKYKPKKDYRKKQGHRQPFSMIKILSIEA